MIRYDRQLVLLLVSNFLASVGIGVAMIAIPWLLATRSDGGVLFGVLMTLSNIALAIATPFIGVLIDRISRKRMMISLRLAFLAGLGIVYVLGKWDESGTLSLIFYYLLGASFYVINIPLRTAFVQELYYGRDYARVNSILEIENQAAAVAIGAVAIVALETFGIDPILLLNALALSLSVGLIEMINYRQQTRENDRRDILGDLVEGFAVLRQNSDLSLLLLVATLPYIIVILYSYLHPVSLGALDGTSGSDYATVEILFALGAIVAGWSLMAIPVSDARLPQAICWGVGLFALVAAAQAVWPVKPMFFIIGALFGALNSATRIFRQTLLMKSVSVEEIGRVGSFLQFWIMILRAITLAIATGIVAQFGYKPALWFAALVPLLGWAVIVFRGHRRPSLVKIHTKETL